ncbi:PREDICTED: RNA-binding protein FUS-like [Priapulus caudatus]|uniref:RNA-binding protein FUS-like n=1 Tax=Priapulus caudatus TaxID=37621 RepID=A0ABM1DYG8_PRICU|nr:PREDICTED: RNA-binding protein FUS-like [Priapulus caudatus]
MKIAAAVVLAVVVGVATAEGYGRSQQFQASVPVQSSGGYGSQSVKVTEAPGYFTTSRYGPFVSGGLRGHGDRSSSLAFQRKGHATGSLFSRDNADATETAKKSRGYEYRYREGHEYTQPKTLYHYDIEEPIWGFADVDNVYKGNGGQQAQTGYGQQQPQPQPQQGYGQQQQQQQQHQGYGRQ